MKREKGNIRKKIIAMLITFAVVMGASNTIALIGLNHIRSSASDISNTYLEMEKEYGRIGKNVEILQKYINIMVVYPDEALASMGDMYGNIETGLKSIETDLKEMEKHAEQTGNKDLVKVFQSYGSGIRGQAILIRQCSQKRQQGDMEAAATMVGTSILESIMAQEELDIALEAEIDSTVSGTQSSMNRESTMALVAMAAMEVLCIAVLICIYLVLNREIVLPAVQAKKKLDQIIIDGGEGRLDLSQRIQVKSKNEIGQLVNGINVFLDTLEHVIGVIKNKSYGMQNSVQIMDTNIYDIHSEVADLSSVMEELSAGTEEISSSTTFINESVQEVSQGIRGITDEVKEGTQFVNEIRERADYIEKMTVKNKNNTDSIVTEIAQALGVCIENSKSVEKINELTETILSIASQTNLLALNAAIEAARAGEAGRGFAVVAEEITELAENSRVTANAIQGINETVTSAVRNLNTQATKMVDFMKQSVLPDYNSFEDMSKQYQRDADEVNTLLEAFYRSATNLDQSMDKIAANIQSITNSMDESAKGVQMSTHNVVTLTEKMEIIGRESENSMDAANELQNTAGKFVSADAEDDAVSQMEGEMEDEV